MYSIRVPELSTSAISTDVWEMAKTMSEFLSMAAIVTETQSAQTQVTIRLTVSAFNVLQKQFVEHQKEGRDLLYNVASAILNSLSQYHHF